MSFVALVRTALRSGPTRSQRRQICRTAHNYANGMKTIAPAKQTLDSSMIYQTLTTLDLTTPNEETNRHRGILRLDKKTRSNTSGMEIEKSVRFAAEDCVVEVESLKASLPDWKRAELWLTRQEMLLIQRHDSLLVAAVESGQSIESENETRRGLELRMQSFHLQRCLSTKNAHRLVLEEQHRQREVGVSVPELIAMKCREVSHYSAAVALDRAQEDACEAWDLFFEDRKRLQSLFVTTGTCLYRRSLRSLQNTIVNRVA